jgi:hypothetical protein
LYGHPQFFVLERAGGVRQIACVDFLTPAVGVAEGASINCGAAINLMAPSSTDNARRRA